VGDIGYAISPLGTEKVEPPACHSTKSTLAIEGSKAWILADEQSAAALVITVANRAVLIDVDVLIMQVSGESKVRLAGLGRRL
jgi:hypothetical protein